MNPHLEEKSAGGVVFRRKTGSQSGSEYQFLIGMHSGYHKWVLPKGLVEQGESDEEAAIREVTEEVGVTAKIVGKKPLKTIEYWYAADFGVQKGSGATGEQTERRVTKYQEEGAGTTQVHKKVIFYLMEVEEDLGKEGWEMSERKWVSFDQGMELLSFETEREVLQSAGVILKLP